MATMSRGARLASLLSAGVAFGAMAAGAQAQAPIFLDQPTASAPSAPGMAQPIQLPGYEELEIRKPNASPAAAAPMPEQPEGGFEVNPPSVDAEDPARRMSLSKADDYLNKMTQDAQQRLGDMVGSTGPGALSAAAPAGGTLGDLKRLAALKRKTAILEEQGRQAKIALDVWGTLYNNEHAKNWREREDKKRLEQQAEEARERNIAAMTAARESMINGSGGPLGGAAMQVEPVVFEVNGQTAYLLLPGSGEVAVRVGSRLASGHKVTRVTAKGVEVELGGKSTLLGFGAQASLPTPPAQPVQPAGAAGVRRVQ